MNPDPTPAVAVRGLTVRFGRVRALDDVTLSVPTGAFFALLGPNGAGKSTLLRCLVGAIPVAPGTVSLLGHDVARLPLSVRQRLSYVAEGQRLPHDLTVRHLERYLAPLYPSWDAAVSARLLERFGLPSARRTGAMSRGQRMLVALWSALAARPALLLLDEPFTGLDVAVKDRLVDGLLETLAEGGLSVLACTHDVAEVELLADWLGVLRDGRVIHAAPLERLREEAAARLGGSPVTLKALYLDLTKAPSGAETQGAA